MPADQSTSLMSSGRPMTPIFFTSAIGTRAERYAPRMNSHFSVCRCVQIATIRNSTTRASTVAIAAPRTPIAGAPSLPKMRI